MRGRNTYLFATAAAAAVLLLLLLRGTGRPGMPAPNMSRTTISRATARALADAIYVALYGVGGWQPWEDEAAVAGAVAACNNDDDLLLLFAEYGCRAPSPSIGCDTLPAAVRRYFDAQQVEQLNSLLAAKGINYRF